MFAKAASSMAGLPLAMAPHMGIATFFGMHAGRPGVDVVFHPA